MKKVIDNGGISFRWAIVATLLSIKAGDDYLKGLLTKSRKIGHSRLFLP
ncbi:MAG: hypothetical protein ACXVBF_11000 [Flavisolibacter sp.]